MKYFHHTPGPWAYKIGERTIVPAGKSGPDFRDHMKVAAICKMRHRESGTDNYNVEMKANAQLIASAPELLEALEADVNFYVSKVTTPHLGEACANGFPLPENIDWPPHVVKAHSAIVKVRGHQ